MKSRNNWLLWLAIHVVVGAASFGLGLILSIPLQAWLQNRKRTHGAEARLSSSRLQNLIDFVGSKGSQRPVEAAFFLSIPIALIFASIIGLSSTESSNEPGQVAEGDTVAGRTQDASEDGSDIQRNVKGEQAADLRTREFFWIEETKDAVRGRLRNPSTAEFRNVQLYRPFPDKDTPVVCGQVNSENGFGGMSGFQGFIGSGTAVGPFLEAEMADGEFARAHEATCVNAPAKQPGESAAIGRSAVMENRWVITQRANRHTCPSEFCGLVGWVGFRERVSVHEMENGWARVTELYNASCRAGMSDYVDKGNRACEDSNGISNEQFAEWIRLDNLSVLQPPDPAETASDSEQVVKQSDDFSLYRKEFSKAANTLIGEGRCTAEEINDYGGWVKSATTYADDPIYFTYCGGDTIQNRIYLDVRDGRIFK